MSTGNAAEWLTAHGFQPGMGGPGDFRVGFNSEHMQATLPGGTPFNWGSDAAAANRGIGGTGAFDPAFTSHFYRPTGGGSGGAAPMGANWPAIAQRESSGNWQANTGNGFYGGLQFTQSSWEAAGGLAFAQRADLASPQQQMQVANKLLAMQGPGAWPNTFVPNAPAAAAPKPGTSAEDQIRAGIVPQHPGIPTAQAYTPQAPSYDNGGAVPIIAHEGEHVLTKGDVSALGGQGGVYAFRQALHYDGGGEVISPSDLGGLLGGSSSPSTHNAAPPPGVSTAPFGPPASPVAGVPGGGQQGAPGQLGPFPTPPGLQAPAPAQAGTPGQQGATKIGGAEPPKGYGTGAAAGGGALGAAEGAAAMAANAFAPGSGVAVQIASQELNRAIQQAGKYVGIGLGGLEETFLPFGGSQLAQSNWITKLAGGLAGASPALPNLAGQAASGPLTPQQAFGGPPSPFGGQQSQTSIEHGVHIDNITIHGDQPARKTATEIQDQLQTVTNGGGLTGQR